MKIIFKQKISNPPTKYVRKKKRNIKLDKNGKPVTETTHYLTANLFYSDSLHWSQKSKIIKFCKTWLLDNLETIPDIEKCDIHIVYHSPKDNYDIDNKGYFWSKIFIDLLKTPTNKQIALANKRKTKIITLNKLKDDSARYVRSVHLSHCYGELAIEIIIKGIKSNTQQQLFT